MSAAAFRRALEDGDIKRLRGMWSLLAPHLPQPETDEQAEIVMHHARTQAATVAFRFRAFSHRWLVERGLPSGLPDDLKPRAERIHPIKVMAVGISVNTLNPHLKPAMVEVRQSMEAAVEDAFASGRKDPAFVKARMEEARHRTMKGLFGRLAPASAN